MALTYPAGVTERRPEVAPRVSALCLGTNGRLTDRLLASDAVRAALLVDLAPAEWLCPTVVEHLRQAQARYLVQAGALGAGIPF